MPLVRIILRKIYYFAIMKQLFHLSLLLLLAACNTEDKKNETEPEDDLGAARNFIRAALDGDYAKARTYLLPDSMNTEYMNLSERKYNETMSREMKDEYKKASINIHEVKPLNDSASVISYSNSYFKKDTQHLKVVKLNNKWLIDFKYYFEAKKDSLP